MAGKSGGAAARTWNTTAGRSSTDGRFGVLGPLLIQVARATADHTLRSGGSGHAAGPVRDLHAKMLVDPFAPTAVPANRDAAGATWAAELTRLEGTPRPCRCGPMPLPCGTG